MNTVNTYLRYLDFKSRIKKRIPYIYSILRYIKWKFYKPFYIWIWSQYRQLICKLKEEKIVPYSINDLRLKSLKNKHRGEIAFIIGNGSSLRAEDLEVLHKKMIYTFASNRINLMYDKTHWRPNCYIAIDRFIYRNNDQTMFMQLHENLDMYFLSKEVYAGIKDTEGKKDKIYVFRSQPNSYYRGVKEFSTDVLKYVVDGFTVTYTALQLAHYMGFKKVYLLGVDCNYGNVVKKDGSVTNRGETSYFTKKYDPNNSNTAYIDGMLQAYELAKRISKNGEFEIYNATRGGMLEVFKRVNIEKIIE